MKYKILSKNLRLSVLIITILLCACLVVGVGYNRGEENLARAQTVLVNSGSGAYLSDLTPVEFKIGYKTLAVDENLDGNMLSLIVNGERKYFDKGLLAHATSTLVFDLGENHSYDYFSTYLGLDAQQSGKGSAKLSVYTSADRSTWTTALEPVLKTSSDEATFLNISIKNVRYLKFYFDSNGTNANDHTCLCDCKIYSDGYKFYGDDPLIKTVEYYDDWLAGKTTAEILNNNTLLLMQRKFVDDIGYWKLKKEFLAGDNEAEHRAMLNWLFNDSTALRDFVTGGIPNGGTGNYIKSLELLSELYEKFSSDLSDTTALFEPETSSTRNRGDVYRTMMISIALTNAKPVYGWVNSGDILDPIARYEALKKTYLASDFHLRYDIFENLCVEEMRYLMSSRINSEEIYWLNAYATTKYLEKNSEIKYPAVYSPHSYIKYGRDWNYSAKGYLEEENFSQYDEKYMLTQYGMSFSKTPRIWMVMEGSHICWGISYFGTNFASAFGVPSHYVRQPDHASFLVYNKDTNGRTIWSIDNDIFGWTKTWMNEDSVGNGNNRMMCDWGTTGSEYVTHMNGTYILLASTALDDQENYENAELVLSLKSATANENLETLYRYALNLMPYHFDAWYGLVKLYISQNKSDAQLSELAEEIAENMYCFPLPMHELLALISKELTARATESATIQLANVQNIDNIALQKSLNVNNDENAKKIIAQTAPCVEEAKYLLGLEENDRLASFSFDGENQNKLVFNSKYASVRYKYSLDSGKNWSKTLVTSAEDLTHTLTNEELESITSANDIYIWLEGWGTSIDLTKAFKIDILEGASVTNLESNDNENRFFGIFTNLEYSLDNNIWQDLTSSSEFLGDKVVFVRNKRTGVTLQGEISQFTFTDNTNAVRSYIPISRLELAGFSSEEALRNDYAKYAIDGKLSTRWHTKWSGGDHDRYITVKLDKTRYVSGIDYTPVGGNGTMYACEIYVSINGEDWTLANVQSGWGNNTTKKQVTFTPVLCQYVKIVGIDTVGGFCSARLIEFFEDTTLDSKQISSLTLVDLPKQEIFVLGQEMNYNGLRAQVIFDDNTTAIIPNELLTLPKLAFQEIGTHEIVVKYGDLQTNFEVNVINIADGVARVGAVYFSSLDSAIANILEGSATENTLELLKNVDILAGFTITQDLIVNGNGHTLSRVSGYEGAIFLVNGASKLTLNNLIINGGAVWSGEENITLKRGTNNSGLTATSALIKMTDKSSLTLNDCVLKNNFNNYSTNAQNTGGAIFLGNTATATLTNTDIKNCYAYAFGSAIYLRDNANLVINSGEISGNSGSSNCNTTAICVDNSAVCEINGGEFINNLAYAKGGVFWVANGKLNINGGNFAGNLASFGAGIYLNGSASVNISDFESMGEIYLSSGKTINLLSPLLNKILNIKLASDTVGTAVAVCEDSEVIYQALKSLVVADRLLYVEGTKILIGDTSTAKTVIKTGERETLFVSLLDAIKGAQSGDKIVLADNVAVSEEIFVEIPLTIDLANFTFEGVDKIKTSTLCRVVYQDNVISVCDHKYNKNVAYTWSEDYKTCVATGQCECGVEFSETVATTQKITTPASRNSEEISSFIAEFVCADFERQEKAGVVTGERLDNPAGVSVPLILAICGGVLVIGGVIVVVILRARKKRK